MKSHSRRLFYINLDDWVWWAWTITAVLLIAGLAGHPLAFIGAMAVTAAQGFILRVRDRSLAAYSVQLRTAYLLLMLMSYPPPMRWFYWLLAAGTLALVAFGYCLLTRVLSLLPWNSRETYTWDRLRRTFFSAPDLGRVAANPAIAGCAGGLCTIEAQVIPRVSQVVWNHAEPPDPARRKAGSLSFPTPQASHRHPAADGNKTVAC